MLTLKQGAILPEDYPMSSSLSDLLKLPAGERAELAMALWGKPLERLNVRGS